MDGIPGVESEHLDRELCLALIERVCISPELRRAARLRDFLRYVSRRALDETGAPITEQEIGVHVFDRSRDYDTGIDNIVRVNASELRKRIASYFQKEGPNEPIWFDIPRGSYTPNFFQTPPDLPTLETMPAIEPSSSEKPAIGSNSRSNRHWLLPVLATLVVLLSAASIWLTISLQKTRHLVGTWSNKPALQEFWAPVLESGHSTDIVVADSSLPIVQEFLKKRIPLSLYLKPDYTQMLAEANLPDDLRSELQRFASRNIGSFTDFRAASRIMALAPGGDKLRLEYARRFHSEALKSDNIILIGSNYSNPWVDLFDNHLSFHIVTDPATRQSKAIIDHPRAGEQPAYMTMPDTKDTIGYSAIAYFPNTEHSSSVLIIAGTTAEATEASVDFLLSEKSMQQLKQSLSPGNLKHFEVLLRTTRLDGTPLSAEIVASRTE